MIASAMNTSYPRFAGAGEYGLRAPGGPTAGDDRPGLGSRLLALLPAEGCHIPPGLCRAPAGQSPRLPPPQYTGIPLQRPIDALNPAHLVQEPLRRCVWPCPGLLPRCMTDITTNGPSKFGEDGESDATRTTVPENDGCQPNSLSHSTIHTRTQGSAKRR